VREERLGDSLAVPLEKSTLDPQFLSWLVRQTARGPVRILACPVWESCGMSDSLRKIELMRARCTGFAEDLLQELEAHPQFPAILDKLIELDGLITRSDIERVVLELRKRDGK
jgi:hypothetical protein